MKIYRIESRKNPNDGLYSGVPAPVLAQRTNHPLPDEDGTLRIGWEQLRSKHGSNVYFGFSGVKQMRAWVCSDEWLCKLDSNDYHVVTYDVPDEYAFTGNHQAIFVKSKAKQIKARNLLEFCKGS